jgi:hypothetical protein
MKLPSEDPTKAPCYTSILCGKSLRKWFWQANGSSSHTLWSETFPTFISRPQELSHNATAAPVQSSTTHIRASTRLTSPMHPTPSNSAMHSTVSSIVCNVPTHAMGQSSYPKRTFRMHLCGFGSLYLQSQVLAPSSQPTWEKNPW